MVSVGFFIWNKKSYFVMWNNCFEFTHSPIQTTNLSSNFLFIYQYTVFLDKTFSLILPLCKYTASSGTCSIQVKRQR